MNTTQDQNNIPPNEPQPLQPQEAAQLKSAQTMITIAIIGSPISLIFGGVILSTICVICAAIAYSKIKKVLTHYQGDSLFPKNMFRQSKIALGMTIFVLVINTISLAFVIPEVINILETGDLSSLYGFNNTPESLGSNSSSIWD